MDTVEFTTCLVFGLLPSKKQCHAIHGVHGFFRTCKPVSVRTRHPSASGKRCWRLWHCFLLGAGDVGLEVAGGRGRDLTQLCWHRVHAVFGDQTSAVKQTSFRQQRAAEMLHHLQPSGSH